MGSYLETPVTEKHYEKGNNSQLQYCACSMQGWRKSQEDAHLCCLDLGDGNSLFAVFDGHGGKKTSTLAAEIFTTILLNTDSYKNHSYSKALTETMMKCDEVIRKNNYRKQNEESKQEREGEAEESETDHSGSTANILLITQKHFYCANSGDSRSALFTNGKTVELSVDHKITSEIQVERIKKAGGFINRGRVCGNLNLTRALGDFEYKNNEQLPYDKQIITCHPDIIQQERNSEDKFIIMGCDGIWERYQNSSAGLLETVRIDIENDTSLEECIAEELDILIGKSKGGDRFGMDNMTMIIITLKEQSH